MPYAFTGTLKRFSVVLEPEKLTKEEKERLLKELGKALMTAH